MRLASLALALAACGCAHTRSLSDALAEIDTSQFALPTDRGDTYALAEHRGKVVVLEFFTTWCVPCLAEVNQLEKLKQRFPGLEVAGVALDLDAARTLPSFRLATGVDFPLLLADEDTRNGSGPFGRVPQLPTTAIVDSRGVVCSAFTGLLEDRDLDSLVRKAER